MKTPHHKLLLALAVFALFQAGNARAVIYDFYVSTTERATGNAANFVNYQYDTATGLDTSVNSYAVTGGVRGSGDPARSSLQLSGDGKYLSWAGFTASSANALTLFDLTTKTFDTSTQVAGSAYVTAWTPDGNRIYAGGVTAQVSPGTLLKGGTTPTALRSAGSYSVGTMGFNNDHLFLSRNSATASGIYRAAAAGLITSSTDQAP